METTDKKRVQVFIQQSGLCSRRKAEDLIAQGLVKVNEKLVRLGDHCEETDLITVSGQPIPRASTEHTYILMNKPKGVVTSNEDELGRETVFDVLKHTHRRKGLFSIGRLDKDTTGLIILTTDGHFAQSIIHPSKDLWKVYQVQTITVLLAEDIRELQKGIYLDDCKLSPCKIRCVGDKTYELAISEGRKRQIRLMIEHVGNQVKNLKRIAIGGLLLEKFNLREGEYKLTSRQELEREIFKKD